MIRASVKAFNTFPRITAAVDRACVDALNRAAAAAAAVAEAESSIRLELETRPAQGTDAGYAAGIKSRRESDVDGSTTPIAHFFDQGTLGGRRKTPKRPRKQQWTVRRGGKSHLATRGDVAGKGIPREGFFAKAHRAGRKVLLAELDRAARR